MTDRLRRRFTEANNSFSRRRFLATSAAIAGGIGATSLTGLGAARAATLKTVRFSEAADCGLRFACFRNRLDEQTDATLDPIMSFLTLWPPKETS